MNNLFCLLLEQFTVPSYEVIHEEDEDCEEFEEEKIKVDFSFQKKRSVLDLNKLRSLPPDHRWLQLRNRVGLINCCNV